MVKNFIIKCLLFICFLTLPFETAFSAVTDQTGNINISMIMQNNSPAGIFISKDGLVDYNKSYGIYKIDGLNVTNKATLTSSGLGSLYNDIVNFETNQSSDTFTGQGCTYSFTKINPSANGVYMKNNREDFSFEFELTFNGFCAPDTYTNSFNIPFTYKSCILGSSSLCLGSGSGDIPFNFSFKIEQPLDVSEIVPLNFGAILPIGGRGGTFTVHPDGRNPEPSDTNSLKYISAATRGEWQVYGIGGKPVNVTLPSEVPISNGSASMTVDNFTYATNDGYIGAQIEIPNDSLSYDAKANFYIGATLHIGENQAPGMYEGEYTVTVSY